MSGIANEIALENVPEMTLPKELRDAPSAEEPTNEFDIAAIAYRLWEERGRPQGDPDRDWYEAERQARSANGSE